MKKLLIILTACLILGGASYADEGKDGDSNAAIPNKIESAGGKHCEMKKDLMLTKEQREKMRKAFFKFQEEKINLEAAIKRARLNYVKVVSDSSSNADAAKAAAQEIANSLSKMVAAKLALKTQISYEILTEKQRKARAFSMLMRGHWKHHRNGRRDGHRKFAFHKNNHKQFD